MIGSILALEMLFKNLLNRKFNYKDLTNINSILFEDEDTDLEKLLFLNYEKTTALKTKNSIKIKSEFSQSGFDFKINFATKKNLPEFIINSSFLTFFLIKEVSISKDGVLLYSNGHLKNNYKKYSVDIHNAIYFFSESINTNATIKK